MGVGVVRGRVVGGWVLSVVRGGGWWLGVSVVRGRVVGGCWCSEGEGGRWLLV